jgi:hypothetical protein
VATILVAAGGGGDAITAAALAAPLNLGEPVVIMTYSGDRLMIDPLPGPPAVGDFTRLNQEITMAEIYLSSLLTVKRHRQCQAGRAASIRAGKYLMIAQNK